METKKNQLVLFAPAKINLALDILRRRPDGYHDLAMVMQTVSLFDTVTVRVGTGTNTIHVHTEPACLPDGPENLAYQAAEAFYDETGTINSGTEIQIEKRIPKQAGMGGGSADAAAVLRILRILCCPDLPPMELERIGEQIGSDVPFCVRGGTALVEGRGERLSQLPAMPNCGLVLCKPNFGLSTQALFGRVRVDQLQNRPDLSAICGALKQQNLPAVAKALRNVFEEVLTPEEQNEIASIQQTMLENGALGAAMTGSGPTVFGVFQERDSGRVAVAALQQRYRQTFMASPI